MIIILCCIALLAVLISIYIILRPADKSLRDSHALITGGSSGIGKSLAAEVIKQGGSVTLLARNLGRLKDTSSALEKLIINPEKQKVHIIACDVSGKYEDVQAAIQEAFQENGPIEFLINCAGISAALTFEDTPVEEFKKLMSVNYMGSVQVTKAALGGMKASGRGGRIVFVSSQAGQLGVFGYTAYSPTKFALRGLAEALQMEVKPYDIYVTVSFPPDTDTPGFREEMDGNKPEETKLISATSGLFYADSVAKQILADTQSGHHLSYNGLDGWMLANVTCGMSPATSLGQVITQGLLMGLLRIISLCYLYSFDRIVSKCKRERDTKAKTQ